MNVFLKILAERLGDFERKTEPTQTNAVSENSV